MIRHRILLKSFAVFFILEMVISTLSPAISWALTAGPTAPEATSFEPVDTTDIVDLKTGDFVYNIPLLEVPGPAGSYPLSLSYHAGIQPDQEASWTGLGFTLNTGSISRLVNGYPDDHNAIQAVTRSYWKGGETTTSTIGLSVGIANIGTVSGGLSFAQDTYKGRGVGGYVGYGMQISDTNIGISTSFNISPYGGASSSMGISLGVGGGSKEALNSSANVSLSINSDSELNVGADAGVSAGTFGANGTSLLAASISSDGSKPSLSVGGGSIGVYSSRSNQVSVSSSSFQIDIPVYYELSVRLGRDYQRYWIDETAANYTYGALYLGDIPPDDVSAFDTYDLADLNLDLANFDNEEEVLGGSFPDVDSYMVMAQGVSGSIKPYHFQQHLFRQNKKDASGHFLVKSYPLTASTSKKPVEFRFLNDFSNRFEAEYGHIADRVVANPDPSKKPILSYFYYADPYKTPFDNGSDGYNKDNNQLAGSKHVEWYTNNEILKAVPTVNPYAEGFINCKAEGFQRQSNSMVGGYSITNASGVTYHYALPAYSYEEYTKSLNPSNKDGERWNELKKPAAYAYTWFLTAVTGPDFVDSNENGLADHGDWGYWVNFEYKKWLGDYKWRNPGEGTNRDLDGEFVNFSSGKKEIYYLDKVITQTHVAVFEKSERLDGREVTDMKAGGFETIAQLIPGKQQCLLSCCPPGGEIDCLPENCGCESLPDDRTEYTIARPSLKLDKVKLFNYDDFAANRIADNYIIREIEFGYDDYSLVPGTPNSFSIDNPSVKKGKLTLKSLSFLGKKGISLIPQTTFNYSKNVSYPKDEESGEMKVDVWGYYKSDFSTAFVQETNAIIGKLTTDESAANVDAWSLNEIKTSLGASIQIEYQSDEYDNVVLAKQQFLRVKEVTDAGTDKLKIEFFENVVLSDYFKETQEVNLDIIGSYDENRSRKVCSGDCDDRTCTVLYHFAPILLSGNGIVDEIRDDEGFIIVKSSDYYNKLKYEPKTTSLNYEEYPCKDNGGSTRPYTWKDDLYFESDEAWPDYFPAGIVSTHEKARPGGGVRVKSIGLNNTLGDSRFTTYEYGNGKTSYEPYQILEPKISENYPGDPIQTKILYKKAVLNRLQKQINISRQVPGPGVLYQYVTVREFNTTSDGSSLESPNYSKYEFEMYQDGMVDAKSTNPSKQGDDLSSGNFQGINFSHAVTNSVVLKDFSSCVGNLKRITLYNTNDDSPVSATTNNYLSDKKGLHDVTSDASITDDITFDASIVDDDNDSQQGFTSKYRQDFLTKFYYQGLIEETFTRSRLVSNKKDQLNPYPKDDEGLLFTEDRATYLGTVSKSRVFPSIQIGQTNINYITGVTSKSENLAFDFYSGEVTQVSTTDSYGNKYLSVNVPAYKNYSGMGLKVNKKTNKNMLTQTSEQYSYAVKDDLTPTGLLSASVQTWSDQVPVLNVSGGQPNVWRPWAGYQWNGEKELNTDGSYPYDATLNFIDHPFKNWDGKTPSDVWQKTGELTLYDIYSHGLEAKDINENFASSKMNKDQNKVIASATNARYDEMAFSSAEYYAGNTEKDGDVSRGEGNPSPAYSHTGRYSLLVDTDKKGFNYTLNSASSGKNKKYRASVWVYLPGKAETQTDLDKVALYYSISGGEEKSITPVLQKNKAKSWYLLNLDIPSSGGNSISIGVRNGTERGAYFDDFRVHPLNATLTSYVYDPFSGELNFILDANNFYTRFEYDAMGRLMRTSKELLNFDFGDGKESYRADAILKETKYNYGKDN